MTTSRRSVPLSLCLGLWCIVAVMAGCGTPRGYDADLTPGDGSAYIGALPEQGYSAEARAAMRAHLAKESWCAWCETTKGLEVHHILPVSRRPDLAANDRNLITLCDRCHRFVAHPGGDSRKWISNIRELCQKRLLCGPETDAP